MTEFWIERLPSAGRIANPSAVGPNAIREPRARSTVRFLGMAGQKNTGELETGWVDVVAHGRRCATEECRGTRAATKPFATEIASAPDSAPSNDATVSICASKSTESIQSCAADSTRTSLPAASEIDEDFWYVVTRAIGKSGLPSAHILVDLLWSKSKEAAVEALADIGGDAALARLREVAQNHPSEYIRELAIENVEECSG